MTMDSFDRAMSQSSSSPAPQPGVAVSAAGPLDSFDRAMSMGQPAQPQQQPLDAFDRATAVGSQAPAHPFQYAANDPATSADREGFVNQRLAAKYGPMVMQSPGLRPQLQSFVNQNFKDQPGTFDAVTTLGGAIDKDVQITPERAFEYVKRQTPPEAFAQDRAHAESLHPVMQYIKQRDVAADKLAEQFAQSPAGQAVAGTDDERRATRAYVAQNLERQGWSVRNDSGLNVPFAISKYEKPVEPKWDSIVPENLSEITHSAVGGVVKGTAKTLTNLGSLTNRVGERMAEGLNEHELAQFMRDRQPAFQQAKESVEHALPSSLPAQKNPWGINAIAENLGGFAPQLAAGALNPAAGLGVVFTDVAADTADETESNLKAKYPDMSEDAVKNTALAIGAADASIQTAITKFSPLQKLVEGKALTDQAKNGLYRRLAGAVLNAGKEGATTSAMSMSHELLQAGITPTPDLLESIHRSVLAGYYGAAAGGIAGGIEGQKTHGPATPAAELEAPPTNATEPAKPAPVPTPAPTPSPAPEPPVPAPVPAPEPPKAPAAKTQGHETTVATQTGPVEAKYEVVEASALKASHNERTFQPNPEHVGGQERQYQTDKNEQMKVIEASGKKFDPRMILTDDPSPAGGPPMILDDGSVIGGNGRSMILKRVYADPQRSEALKASVRDSAAKFGIDPAAIDAMQEPVIVRRLTKEQRANMNPVRAAELSRKLQAGLTATLDPAADQASRAKVLLGNPETLRTIESVFKGDKTVREVMADPKLARQLVEHLQKSGVLTPQEASQFLTPEGLLNKHGKDLVEGTLTRTIVDDPQLLEDVPPHITNKLTGNLADLAFARAREGFDLSKPIKSALEAYHRFRAADLGSDKDALDTWLNVQQQLTPDPIHSDAKAKRLLELMVGENTKQFKERVRQYAEDARSTMPGQGRMFGGDATPDQAFDDAFHTGSVDADLIAGEPADRIVEQPAKPAAQAGGDPAELTSAQAVGQWYARRFNDAKHADTIAALASVYDGKYVKRDVPIHMIDANTMMEGDVDQAKVDRYAKERGKAPPIVAVPGIDTPYSIADGTHRLLAAKQRGDTTIEAYVPDNEATKALPVRRFPKVPVEEVGASLRKTLTDTAKDQAQQMGEGREFADAAQRTGDKNAELFDRMAQGDNAAKAGPSPHQFTPEEGKAPAGTTLDKLRPVQLPELVQLARELMGQVPGVKRSADWYGVFYPAKGKIDINPITAKDPFKIAKTVAHEIGHLIDWLDAKKIDRGNLIARVRSIDPLINHLGQVVRWMKDSYNGRGATNKELYAECKLFSSIWRPGNMDTAYRKSSVEIFADMLSGLLNSPGEVEKRAPLFYNDFLETLAKKPSVWKSFMQVQDLLAGDPKELAQMRADRLTDAFGAGREAMKAGIEAREAGKKSISEKLMQLFATSAHPWYQIQDRVNKAGYHTIPSHLDPHYIMQELRLSNNDVKLYVDDVQEKVVKPMIDTGATQDDLGQYLFLTRVETGRSEVPNPQGHTPETAKAGLKYLRDSMQPKAWAALEKSAQTFRDMSFDVVERAHDLGIISDTVWNDTIVPNKDNYAHFGVVDYLERTIGARLYKQIGTFKDIGNPFDTTMMKMLAMIRANNLVDAKRKGVTFLQMFDPMNITKEPVVRGPGGRIADPPRPPEGFDHIEVPVNGQPRFFRVDKYLAKTYQLHDIGMLAEIANSMRNVMVRPFHAVFVKYNPFWMSFNLVKDFRRTYRNRGGNVGDLLAEYAKGIPPAIRRARGITDPLIRQMERDKALEVPYVHSAGEDQSVIPLDRLLEQYGMGEQKDPSKIMQVLSAPFRFFETAGTFSETLPKVAEYQRLGKQGVAGQKRADIVRNQVGTPFTQERGLATPLTNSLFMYSNVAIQGLRADAQIAMKPKTAGGWWMRFAMTTLLPKMAMKAAKVGLFGAGVSALMKTVGQYDLANYIVLPLGWWDDDKDKGERRSLIMRIPQDHVDQFLGNVVWQGMDHYDEPGTALANVVGGVKSQVLPNFSPIFQLGGSWSDYLSGENPVDPYRNRSIIGRMLIRLAACRRSRTC
jgi:hypothetical protein